MLELREVLITWRDTPDDCFIATVGGDWSLNDNDDEIFFYFENENEYQECLKNGEADFTMEEDDGE